MLKKGELSLKKNRVLWDISKWFLSPSPWRSQRGFVSNVYFGNLIEYLGVNITILLGPPYDGFLWRFWFLDLSALGLQQLTDYNSYFPILALVPTVVSCESWLSEAPTLIHLSLQYWGQRFSLWICIMDPRRLVDFQDLQFSTFC